MRFAAASTLMKVWFNGSPERLKKGHSQIPSQKEDKMGYFLVLMTPPIRLGDK